MGTLKYKIANDATLVKETETVKTNLKMSKTASLIEIFVYSLS